MTSDKVQFSEHAQRFRFPFSSNQIVRLDSEHAQSDGKSVNRGRPVLNLPREVNPEHPEYPEVVILGADQKERGLLGRQWTVLPSR